MVEFPLSDKVFPVVVCLHKLSFSFLTLSSMLPLSSEIASKVFFLSVLLNCCGWPYLLMSGVRRFCVCVSAGCSLFFSVLLYFEISTFCLALLLTQHNGLCQNTCEGYGRKQMHAHERTRTHKVHLATALWEALDYNV